MSRSSRARWSDRRPALELLWGEYGSRYSRERSEGGRAPALDTGWLVTPPFNVAAGGNTVSIPFPIPSTGPLDVVNTLSAIDDAVIISAAIESASLNALTLDLAIIRRVTSRQAGPPTIQTVHTGLAGERAAQIEVPFPVGAAAARALVSNGGAGVATCQLHWSYAVIPSSISYQQAMMRQSEGEPSGSETEASSDFEAVELVDPGSFDSPSLIGSEDLATSIGGPSIQRFPRRR